MGTALGEEDANRNMAMMGRLAVMKDESFERNDFSQLFTE